MEDFVNFEIAKTLKEKGFKEECLAYYTSEYTLYNNMVVLCDDKYLEVAEIDYNECLTSNNSVRENKDNNICDAPTISQVLKWLREEKKISIEVSIHCSLKWMCGIYDFSDGIADFTQYGNNGIDDTVYILYDSYEQAALASIEYVLDNLI